MNNTQTPIIVLSVLSPSTYRFFFFNYIQMRYFIIYDDRFRLQSL